MNNRKYDPTIFEEDHFIDSKGLAGWLVRRRVMGIIKLVNSIQQDSTNIKLLDVGCGYGEILNLIHADYKVGIDINQKALNEAREKVKNGVFYLCDFENDNFPFDNGTFDIVVCSEVLEHVDDPMTLAKKIINITKDDGYICVTLPNDYITTLGRFILRKKPYKSPAHKTVFSWSLVKEIFHDVQLIKGINVPFNILPFMVSSNLVAIFKK